MLEKFALVFQKNGGDKDRDEDGDEGLGFRVQGLKKIAGSGLRV